MARIRSIKPEMRRSLTVCSWPIPVRWTFAGLLGYLDDEGRGIDDTRLVKAELYPLDDDITPRRVDSHLATITAQGPLCRYEVDGRRFMHITSWSEHQRVNRPTPSRIPPCPLHEDSLSAHGGNSDASLPRAQARAPADQGSGSREQGREQGTVAQVVDPPQVRTARAPDDEDPDRKPRTAPEAVAVRLGCDDDTAERIAAEIQRRHAPKHPVAYIGRMSDVDLGEVRHSLRNGQATEPRTATPSPPPIGQLCRHGMPPPCPVCAEETPA